MSLPVQTFLQGASAAAIDHLNDIVQIKIEDRFDQAADSFRKTLHAPGDAPQWVMEGTESLFDSVWDDVRDSLVSYLMVGFGKATGKYLEPIHDTPPDSPELSRNPLQLSTLDRLRLSLQRARAWIVYRWYPCDISFWAQMRDPGYLLLFTLAVGRAGLRTADTNSAPAGARRACPAPAHAPGPHVRVQLFPRYGIGAMFWLVLGCLIERRDEYQLCMYARHLHRRRHVLPFHHHLLLLAVTRGTIRTAATPGTSSASRATSSSPSVCTACSPSPPSMPSASRGRASKTCALRRAARPTPPRPPHPPSTCHPAATVRAEQVRVPRLQRRRSAGVRLREPLLRNRGARPLRHHRLSHHLPLCVPHCWHRRRRRQVLAIYTAFLQLPYSNSDCAIKTTFPRRASQTELSNVRRLASARKAPRARGGLLRRLFLYDVAVFVFFFALAVATALYRCWGERCRGDGEREAQTAALVRTVLVWCRTFYAVFALPFFFFMLPVR